MHVRVKTNPTGPLRVIGSLPDARLAMLEGLNGIGKTLAVRVLQLCTGTMPYDPRSPAWESLCEGLGEVEVEVTGLAGAASIRWAANSADWDADHGPIPNDSWFRSITIDGSSATLDDVRQVVSVTRLAGDEELTDTFAAEAEAHAAAVHRWSSRHAGPGEGPLSRLERSAEDASKLFTTVSVEMLGDLRNEASSAREDLVEKRETARQLQLYRGQTREASDLLQQLREMRSRAPEVASELAEVDDLIKQKRIEQEKAQRDVTRLAAQVGRTEPLKRELRNAERTLLRNLGKLADASRRAARQAAGLNIEAEVGAVFTLIHELEQRESELLERQQELDKAPAMISLLGNLGQELAAAESSGLGDQPAVEYGDLGVHLTVTQTRAGMRARQGHLEDQPPPPQAKEISQELAKVKRLMAGAEALRERLDQVARFGRLVDKNEDRVEKALQAGAGGEAGQALQRASSRRRECDQMLLELAARRAALAQRLGTSGDGTSEQALSKQLDGLLQRLTVSKDQIEEEAKAAEELAAEAEAELAVAAEFERERKRTVSGAEATIRSAVGLLDSDARLVWVREALDMPNLLSSSNIDELHEKLERAQGLTRDTIDRLGDLRHQLNAIENALQGSARQLRGQAVGTSEYVAEIQAWLASTFSAWFNNPRVRRELLPASDDEDIAVDLSTRRVVWSEGGVERSRPLEAFSSGEQAFAYTRARLALLDDDPSPATNRLIVLDEFGAFIAHHLLQGLLTYLKDRTAEKQNDQLLLILPLSNDYSQMAQSAMGDDAKRYGTLAKQIREHKYATTTVVR